MLTMRTRKVCRQANIEKMWDEFIRSGRKNRRLRDALCEVHFHLARTFARRYARERRLDFDDVLSWATDGLLFAIGDYDPAIGPFRTFALWCMKLEVRRPAHAEFRRRTEATGSQRATRPDVLPDTTVDDRELAEHLLSCLGERRQRIVRWHLNDGLTYAEIAQREGCSASNVCLLFNDALRQMKKMIRNGEES